MSKSETERLRRREHELEAEVERLRARMAQNRHRLEASEQRQRAIFDSAIDFAIIATTQDGEVTDWNTGAERILGWSAAEMIGERVERFFTPEDRASGRVAHEMRRALDDGSASDERWHLRRDGTRFWASGELMLLRTADGTQLGFLKVLRDRTAQHTEQEELAAELSNQQDFSRLALSSVGGVGAWTYDIAQDRFYCSAAISELYGLDPAEGASGVSGARFLTNVHPDDRPALDATMAGGSERRGDIEMEYRLRHPGGVIRWVLSRGHTYLGPTGAPARRIGIGVETTQRRELEEQLRQSQKMEAVGQLTGGLAHDFNNLLTGIIGSLELLGTRVSQGRFSGVERYITAAQGAAARAAALTHRLLAFSRRQTLDPKPTDVNRLVAGMEEIVRRTVGAAVAVEVVTAGGLWPTLVDPNQLENALLNLCLNARDAMPDGGRLTMETANRWLDARAARDRDVTPGQYISLCVSDTGTGMTPAVIAKAFDPFFTTKPAGEGTGLGLSMIYGFARQSRGHARIYSEFGKGTVVCLYLPRFLGAEGEAETAAELAEVPRARDGETVLVVDDEPTVRMLVAEVLEELGYAAIEAADGPAGLRVLQSNARVDLLVTDVGLPGGMNGRQMADAARATRPLLKILFITGYAENAVVGDGHLKAGMHVMTKPFAMEALASRIKELISEGRVPNNRVR